MPELPKTRVAADMHNVLQRHTLDSLVATGAVTSITLTFFHPLLWVPVGFFFGIAALRLLTIALSGAINEPPLALVALIWILATLVAATVYGAYEDFYNIRQIAFVFLAFILAYWISLIRIPTSWAWAPFLIFSAYFLVLIIAGRDPGEALTRNSRNFVSVIVLALSVSAVILSKPRSITPFHLLMAFVVLLISVWSTGRAAILAAVMLNGGLVAHVLLRGKTGLVRTVFVLTTLVFVLAVFYAGFHIAESNGYLTRLEQRGLTDAPRLAMIAAYFQNIQPSELLFGRNYYDNSYLARFAFNLHNSYLSAWAHLGLSYLLLILSALAVATLRIGSNPALVIFFLSFAARAFTDTQMLVAKYDYVFIAVLFILLRVRGRSQPPSYRTARFITPRKTSQVLSIVSGDKVG